MSCASLNHNSVYNQLMDKLNFHESDHNKSPPGHLYKLAIRYVLFYSIILDLSLQNSLWTNEVVKDVLGHVSIHSRQWIIQQVHISVAV